MSSLQVAPVTNVNLAPWAAPLLQPRRVKVVHGGRGSGKSWQVAILLLLIGMTKPIRWVCMREVQESIEQSSKQVLEDMIETFGWSSFWRVYRNRIEGNNGSRFTFRGMNTVTSRNVRSLEGIDGIWFEEAQYMSRMSAEILYPTIRKEGSELWFTFNPQYRQDAIWKDFCTDTRRARAALVIEVNYYDNPWFPPDLEEERLNDKEDQPDRYAHIWLGKPDDEGAVRKVLPYALIEACAEAWDKWIIPNKYQPKGRVDVGLDVADTGADRNALVARQGPVIWYAKSWVSPILGDTARTADLWCREHSVRRLYYDEGGIGAGIRSTLVELVRSQGKRPYRAEGVNFGGEVMGPEEEYSRDELNQDHFARRNSQLGWALHLRARRTQRLLDGSPVRPEDCLFIDKSRVKHLDSFLGQLAQPEWKEDTSGRIVIDKQPKKQEGSVARGDSPDLYDAAALAFAADSEYGLTVRR